MKLTVFASIFLVILANNVSAADNAIGAVSAKAYGTEVQVDISPNKESTAVDTPSTELNNFCFIPDTPPADVKYTVIKKLKVGKGMYGSVKDILPKFASVAQKKGADAIIGYTGSQLY